MKGVLNSSDIYNLIKDYSAPFISGNKETAIILAAGHGKRIKSQTSKMLHKIWEVPTVERVCIACSKGLKDSNIIVVVGIKAEEVVKTIGKKAGISYAYQEIQKGTGHAVQIAMENISDKTYDGTVFVFPGDMGLIDEETIRFFKDEFYKSNSDMMVLTGLFEGPVEDNHYGRIIRVPAKDTKNSKLKDSGKVIEILEYKDIAAVNSKTGYTVNFKKKKIKFSRKELLENREFNSSVYAFKYKPLAELIQKIESNNAQNEIYLTDLIRLFNQNGYSVEAVAPRQQFVLMGFNNKSVLKEMDAIARRLVFDKLKDIVVIDDPDDFFIEENVVDEIINLDNQGLPLDIHIGKGVYVGKGVKMNYNVKLGKNVFLDGEIIFGKNVVIKDNSRLSCFYGQKIEIGDHVEIYGSNIIKGNVSIGPFVRIESGVRITGSDQNHCIIGSHVIIKGLTYVFGSKIDEHIFIEHSVLLKKRISKPEGVKSDNYNVRFYLPEVEGAEGVKEL
ncbi:MAG: multidrug transporter [Ignavibacteriae bacterium HGW-Ignavibacteriae-3]|nr:MAG: multidrug transporter [Ignavibacteriae bacterium HGW-Ignavibacteriae-3]